VNEVGGVYEQMLFVCVCIGGELYVSGMFAEDCVASWSAPLVQFNAHTPVVVGSVAYSGVLVV
jgi:hypothetical protein